MKIIMSGAKGASVLLAIKANPERTSAIIRGTGPNARVFKSSEELQEIGKIGVDTQEADFYIFFLERPWSFSVRTERGKSPIFTTTSEDQGRANVPILTPDIVGIKIVFEELKEDGS